MKSDRFGIAASVLGAVRVLFQSARRTGRTTMLVNSLRDGDRVVFLDQAEARRVQHLCREKGLDVHCIVHSPATAYEIPGRYGKAGGHLVFDHSWLEAFYQQAIYEASMHVWHITDAGSSPDRAYIETPRQLLEFERWHP